MRALLENLSSFLRPTARLASTRPIRQRRRQVQVSESQLEERRVMSTTLIVDMTAVGRPVPRPTHTQELYLNFDGKHNDGNNISAFVPVAGQDRDAAIQDILYRVSELFAPFNIQVHREFGDGAYSKSGGDTTVFVGGDFANRSTSTTGIVNKFTYASTPFAFSDTFPPPNQFGTRQQRSLRPRVRRVDAVHPGLPARADPGGNTPSQWTDVEKDFFCRAASCPRGRTRLRTGACACPAGVRRRCRTYERRQSGLHQPDVRHHHAEQLGNDHGLRRAGGCRDRCRTFEIRCLQR